ncbi:phosphate ABC transporter permease subunit PstC [Blastococcus sp. MG754426]|uniref:phosphate ABC transporter permease subunit PstC n=1 Tax=unclassified Blastococcus TaxID=2619396 RepID=UPI001EF08847|nr:MULTISPECIES: phosphate ABC transporter permease subunit PstC [unclassified Blastococcus]MCF6509878.1 phosphate ABC transporter permease subunit PstC [Blastococcus sp. MG754426]MCF6512174.1 phosphate ABC transporter permease subunit PstC [Blastococcus sp. MG754427]MCF6737038.1 phosphate ABC transporter permease subunit PstC [Blastococcus sp. KM273129]
MTATRTPSDQSTTKPPRRPGDRIFAGSAKGAGILILVILAGVAVFLMAEALPALTAPAEEIPGDEGLLSYIAPLLFGTLLSAVIALLVATPLAVAIALFITHYAPRRMAQGLGYVVDLLAAIPSIVYGFWGIFWLAPKLVPFYRWLEENLGFIPLFAGPTSSTGRTMLTVGLVLAIMILPIISAISREVFRQVPTLHKEAALALGATRWEMIKMAVIPYGKSGIIGGAMLGLGRALGETMAVAIILSVSGGITFNLISSANPATIAANIALDFPESTGIDVNTLIASGLALFVITLAVNMLARWIVNRRADFSGAN